MKSVQKGFTLIELMIVVAIIGILAAIAIPQYQNYIAKSQVSRVMSETGGLKTAIESCLLDGKTTIGTGATECDLGWTNSNLLGAAATPTSVQGDGLKVTLGTGVEDSSIEARFGASAAQALQVANKRTLTWTRNGQTGAWTCTTKVETKYRPSGCAGSGS
ncbi:MULTISPECIES: pilin [unclassified Acinetobacter]|uniref:pilin n=1 Tax=unclassified Acinetobacter TaxID=196816 RepID=UPI0015D162CB|nr:MULTISPECIES: pilin [unclassified Acinetobacter]